MRTKDSEGVDRRGFLRAAGIGSAAAAAAAAAPVVGASEAQAYDPGAEQMRSRYKPDAPDVQSFYRTNRYETLKR